MTLFGVIFDSFWPFLTPPYPPLPFLPPLGRDSPLEGVYLWIHKSEPFRHVGCHPQVLGGAARLLYSRIVVWDPKPLTPGKSRGRLVGGSKNRPPPLGGVPPPKGIQKGSGGYAGGMPDAGMPKWHLLGVHKQGIPRLPLSHVIHVTK